MLRGAAVTADTGALLTGWGRTAPTFAHLTRPVTTEDVTAALAAPGPRGVLARGLGRSYGDAAQNAGGRVLEMPALDEVVELDLEAGTVTAAAGLSLDELLRAVVPHGWYVHVTPGTTHVTLGGAFACDVHGKNHHAGSFSSHVEWIELASPARGIQRLTPEDPAFRATAGGMGLTGVITTLKLSLQRIETSAFSLTTERAADLDDLMARMEESEAFRYSVAWIDCLARGRSLGRGVLMRGDHARVDELPANRSADPLRYDPRTRLAAPPVAPPGLLNRATIRAFNTAYFHRAPRHSEAIEEIDGVLHPLDAVRGWNRLYGPRGFVQYQSQLPFGAEETVRALVETLSNAGIGSFLAALKRFGPGAPLLSFPRPGWTLAVDVPATAPGLAQVLDRADGLVAEAGGRIYLAKDSRLRPDLVDAMYPELAEWRAIRDRLDPERVMASDLSRRLGLL